MTCFLRMVCTIVLCVLIAQVLIQACFGAMVPKLREEDLETLDTDSLPLSESFDQTKPALVSEEFEDWDEWDEYEEEPENPCNLTSFEINNRASYLCQDGTAWSVGIAQTDGEKCIYSCDVKNPSGKNETKKIIVNCADAQEWLEDLMQYDVLAGIPATFLFNSKAPKGENTQHVPIIYQPFPNP